MRHARPSLVVCLQGWQWGHWGVPGESDRETEWHCCCTPAELTEEFLAEFKKKKKVRETAESVVRQQECRFRKRFVGREDFLLPVPNFCK